MNPLDPVRAQLLLLKCTGNEIWSVEECRQQGIPQNWIDELADAYESGFDRDAHTIYVQQQPGVPMTERPTNQYYGVMDLHLAYKLAEFVGIDSAVATRTAFGRVAEVRALQEALDEI